MAKGSSKIGSLRQETRNQKRKRLYAEQRGIKRRRPEDAPRHRIVGERGIHRYCGNVACRSCFAVWHEDRERRSA